MKYIIEFEDEPSMVEAGLRYYQCKQVPYWGLSPEIIKNLTPYTEPDREAIEDEVWSLAREIAYCMSLSACEDAGMLCDDDIYTSATGVLEKLSYQEAKAKYEAWKKRKEEIKVGDEVILYENTKMIVVQITDNREYVQGIDENGECYESIEVNSVKKTGRHFSDIEKLLKKMRGEE